MVRSTTGRQRIAAGALSVGAALMAFGYFAPTASATHVEPTPIAADNNLKCAEVDSSYIEFKIDEQPTEKTYSLADLDILPGDADVPASIQIAIDNVVVDDVAKTVTFDFSATVEDGDDADTDRDPFFFEVVIVKVSTGGNQYNYNPPVSSDTGLVSPKDSISHVSFCQGEPGEPTDDGGTDGTTDTGGATTGGATDTGGATTGGATDTGGQLPDVVTPQPNAAPTQVAGVQVAQAARQTLPATGQDYSLMLLGGAFVLAGAASLVLRREVLIRS